MDSSTTALQRMGGRAVSRGYQHRCPGGRFHKKDSRLSVVRRTPAWRVGGTDGVGIMAKIDSAVAESFAPKAGVVHNILGERGARQINGGWKGDFVADATAAAFQYGLLVSARMLPQDRAEYLLRFNFDFQKVEPDYWSAVWQ